MPEEFDFFITSMPGSRPADYYTGCLDGSVFIDFNDCWDGRICLKRISFDGYGCCNLSDEVKPVNKKDSAFFKQMMNTKAIDQPILTAIIKKTIRENETLIWQDALHEYHLL